MTRDELQAFLYAEGLARVADHLLALAAPTIRVYLQATAEVDIPVGASKMGGLPDLPEGVPWPSWHEPMAFIAQFNLAEVAPYDLEHALPPSGLLSFFYETDGEPLYAARWGLPADAPYPDDDALLTMDLSRSWRVLYHPEDPTTFRRLALPPELNEQGRYQPGAVRFALEDTLPDIDGPEMLLPLTDEERSNWIGILNQINSGQTWEEEGHHLLGYPFDFGEWTLITCQEEASGVRTGWEQADPAQLQSIAREASARWRELLQVSGSDVTGMVWGGAGYLHWVIERDALRDRDFSRVWLTMQFL